MGRPRWPSAVEKQAANGLMATEDALSQKAPKVAKAGRFAEKKAASAGLGGQWTSPVHIHGFRGRWLREISLDPLSRCSSVSLR